MFPTVKGLYRHRPVLTPRKQSNRIHRQLIENMLGILTRAFSQSLCFKGENRDCVRNFHSDQQWNSGQMNDKYPPSHTYPHLSPVLTITFNGWYKASSNVSNISDYMITLF